MELHIRVCERPNENYYRGNKTRRHRAGQQLGAASESGDTSSLEEPSRSRVSHFLTGGFLFSDRRLAALPSENNIYVYARGGAKPARDDPRALVNCPPFLLLLCHASRQAVFLRCRCGVSRPLPFSINILAARKRRPP